MRGDDLDDAKTPNGTFDLRVVSVSPQDEDIDFVLKQQDQAGVITHKGCLNYDVSQQKYGPVPLSLTVTDLIEPSC